MASLAASSNFLLGVSYSEWGPYYAAGTDLQMAADSAGALYILAPCKLSNMEKGPSCLTKLSVDGKTVVWRNNLGARAGLMAVDPNGNVYLSLPSSIAKLGIDGSTVIWSAPITTVGDLKVDTTGRAFVLSGSSVVRLSTTGTIDATFSTPLVPGTPAAIAVDATGSYILVTYRDYPSNRFALLGPAAPWITFTPSSGTLNAGIAVAPGGDPVIYGTDIDGKRTLQRFDANGRVVFTKAIPARTLPGSTNEEAPGNLAIDAAGNAYITSYTSSFGAPVRNSLATCGSAWLGVYAPDGSVLQITYLPGVTSTEFAFGLIATGGSSVFVLDVADTKFSPTQIGSFPQYPYGTEAAPASFALTKLSPNPSADIKALACAANGASFLTNTAVAPGELIALYGNGLGPEKGVAPAATFGTPYPTRAAETEVTFDGLPAPLVWVQESQVNVAVPWSVTGPTTEICVTYSGVKTNCLTRPVASFAPGVFTVDGVHAAAVNQDGTLNSAANPAPRNSIVAIWATGLGPISPSLPDGSVVTTPLPVNSSQPAIGTLSCAGRGCPVTLFTLLSMPYAGPAPAQIAGMTQINVNVGAVPPVSLTVAAGSSSGPYSNTFQLYIAGE